MHTEIQGFEMFDIKFNGKKVISSFFQYFNLMLGIWFNCVIFVFINLENCYIALKKGIYLFPLKYRQQQYFISPHNYYKRKKKSLENSPKKARALIG